MRNRGVSRSTIHDVFLITVIVFCLLTVVGTVGCSDSGGKSKPVYYMTGYNGVEDSTASINSSDDELIFDTEFPWFVNMTFQVFDEDLWGVSDLAVKDFELLEDNIAVDLEKSEMNIRQRNTLPPGYKYTLKTVLIVDNTPSAALGLENSIEAAQVVVDNMDEMKQQEIAIVSFDTSGDPILIQDFTNNTSQLNNSLRDLKPSYGTTNFYGAVIDSLSLWEAIESPWASEDEEDESPAATSFVQGVLVAITDGLDTSNLYDVNDAIAARGNQQIITIAVGSDLPNQVLSDLEALGNAGYYLVTNPNIEPDESNDDLIKKENLCENLLVVQNRVLAYADAFYWLQYKTFTTSKDQDLNHDLLLSIKNNGNEGLASATNTVSSDKKVNVSGSFDSSNLFSGSDGIYFDASAANPDGISEEVITIEPGQDEATTEISALTYSKSGNNPSQYVWQSLDENIITVTPDENDSSKATISVGDAGQGQTEIIVTDINNNSVQATLPVTVQIRSPSYEFIQYAVESIGPWFVDATFQVRIDSSEHNQWDWVTDLIPENFTVKEGPLNNQVTLDSNLGEINLRKRNWLPSEFSYSLKTVLLIDNTPSVDGNLALIKDAAKAFVDRAFKNNNPNDNTDSGPLLDTEGKNQQEIAIFSFDQYGDHIFVQDFSSDSDVLYSAIDSIAPGYGSTDFYGGMIESLNLWENDASPWEDKNTAFTQGFVIALSDGWNSFAGFVDSNDVLKEIGVKEDVLREIGDGIRDIGDIDCTDYNRDYRQVISVSVGDDLVSRNSDDLITFGNSGFYSVPDPGEELTITIYTDKEDANGKPKDQSEVTYTSIEKTLMDIQDQIVDFANSFYWLEYKSYTIPAEDCNDLENVEIMINNNQTGNSVTGQFRTCEFFEGDLDIIYINASPSNPLGESTTEMIFDPAGILFENPTYDLSASTYLHGNIPDYEWQSGNTNIVEVLVDDRFSNNSRATLVLPDTPVAGSAQIRVTDRANGGLRTFFTVNVVADESVVAYYPFDGNADDASANKFNGQVFGAEPALNRFGDCDCAYSFDGIADYIALPLYYGSGGGAYSNLIDEITVCAWVKSAKADKNQRIVSFDAKEYWTLGFDWDHGESFGFTNKLKTFDWGYNVAGDVNYLASDMNFGPLSWTYFDDQWRFVCASYKTPKGGGDISTKIYVDGMLKNSKMCDSCKPIGPGETRYGFIGAGSMATSFNGQKETDTYFEGIIDDVLIVNRALTYEEILGLYHRGGWKE